MKTQELASPRWRGASLPQPIDAPLLTFETAAAYLGTTPDGIRAALKGQHENDQELTQMLRRALVVVSERRRFIRKNTLMEWLNHKAALEAATRTA
jgi:hypothetical protein